MPRPRWNSALSRKPLRSLSTVWNVVYEQHNTSQLWGLHWMLLLLLLMVSHNHRYHGLSWLACWLAWWHNRVSDLRSSGRGFDTRLKRLKPCIALHRKPISELRGVSCHMASHSVTSHPTQVNAPALTTVRQASTRFTYPRGMEGWVDLSSLIAARLGIKSPDRKSDALIVMPPATRSGHYQAT